MSGKTLKCILLILIMLLFAGYSLWAQTPVGAKVKLPTAAKLKSKMVIKKTGLKIINVSASGIGKQSAKASKSNGGDWQWRITIANTGTVPVDKNSIYIKASQIYGGDENECNAGQANPAINIMPGKKVQLTSKFNYIYTEKLRFDIMARSQLGSTPLESRVIRFNKPTAKIEVFTFTRDQKKWTAVVKNTSTYPISFNFDVMASRGGSSAKLFDRATKKLKPNEKQTLSGRHSLFEPGETLEARIGYVFNNCSGAPDIASVDSFAYTY